MISTSFFGLLFVAPVGKDTSIVDADIVDGVGVVVLAGVGV